MVSGFSIKKTTIVETDDGFIVDLALFDGSTLENSSNSALIRWTLKAGDQGPRLVILQKAVLESVRTAIDTEIAHLLQLAASTR